MEKIDVCKNYPENSSTTKVPEHIASAFSMSTILSFKSIENKHDVYRDKDCMKEFCEFLTEHAMEIINFLKNEVINKRAAGIYIFVKKGLKINMRKIKNIEKLGTIVIIQVNIVLLYIAYVIQSIVYLKKFL